MIKALIFDFDGLILDTETPEYEAWRDIYLEHGQNLTLETWGQIVGGMAATDFRPLPYLQTLTGRDLSAFDLPARASERSMAHIITLSPLPGVLTTLDEARRLGLKLAVASSSPHRWVDGHLLRLGLADCFDVVKCAEDVAHTKPEPDLYLSALATLGVSALEAVVFEDSPNGVAAARRAGIFVVAVPNPVTVRLRMQGENLRLNSLADFGLDQIMDRNP
jgi:HAD superfamily hydrolase (TIGR01509 family)